MSKRINRQLQFRCAVVVTCACQSLAASAAIVIPTNLNGADAELRESETNVDLFGVPLGTNRGTSTELASRVLDAVGTDTPPTMITNPFPTNDRSSVMLMKFDISGLPDSSDAFWNDKQVSLRLAARNNGNFNNLVGANPSNPSEQVNLQFRVLGLEPGNVYADDNALATERTDRLGNPYVSSAYEYDWDESAVTFYNAPGITPHCMLQGSCLDNSIPSSDANSVVQTLGIYDDFNSDTRVLGTFLPPDPLVDGASDLQVGQAIDFTDANLKQLVFDAQAAGRDHVSLMVHIANDGTRHQPTVGRMGTTTDGMLNRNYLVIPKEMTPLNTDPDSPFSGADNTSGAFSPQLRVFVPEPTCFVLVALGSLLALGTSRFRRV